MDLSRSYFEYQHNKKEDGDVVAEILEIKDKHRRFGVPRVTVKLRRKGFVVNEKRVYRLLKALNFLVPRKKLKHKIQTPCAEKFAAASKPNQVWAMDFISDRTVSGSTFRCLTIVDTYSRFSPNIHVSSSMSDFCVVKVLNSLKESSALPSAIILDNGPEFANHRMIAWARHNGINLNFIDPGKPVQNAYIESFNGRFRDECLNEHKFTSTAHARAVATEWIDHYNNDRPHSSLDYLTPKEFASQEGKA